MTGVTQIVILDGNRVSRTLNVVSSDGTPEGTLSWLQALLGIDGVNPTSSANPLPVVAPPYTPTPLGYQQITAGTLSAAQTLAPPTGATFALISCAGGNVSWRDDGAAPTATVGTFLYDGQPPQTFSGNLRVAQFIKINLAPVLNVSYYS